MPFPRPNLTQLRTGAMQDITASDLPNADGFLRRSPLRVLAWVQAGLAQLHYGYLDWISRQSTPFTSTEEYMEGWAALAPTPVRRNPPTYAAGSARWSGAPGSVLPAGTLCARDDGVQYAIAAEARVDTTGLVIATVAAVLAGANGNADITTPLSLLRAVPGINQDGAAAIAITGGDDLEPDSPLRSRMLESYAAPPHGGNQADYVTWALQVPGVTRAWATAGIDGGTIIVYMMLDAAEAAFSGFPQGTDGVAALETRDIAATGDQLAVADYIYPRRPVTPLVYGIAPVAAPVAFTIAFVTPATLAQRAQAEAALIDLFVQKGSPLADTTIEQSECNTAIAAVGGLPGFAILVPASWPLRPVAGHLFTLGVVTYP